MIFAKKSKKKIFEKKKNKQQLQPITSSSSLLFLQQTLVSNGATLVAKTVMDELAYCLTGVNVHFGTPINPCSPTLIPGGSSSGAAVAVASHLVDFAIGTDAGGSVRVPAAFCSVLGLRPTCSRISLNGLVPFSPSIQCVGIYAREPQVMLRIAQILLPSSSTASSSSFSISVQPNCLIVPSQAFDLVHDPSVRYKLDEFISFLKTFIRECVLLKQKNQKKKKKSLFLFFPPMFSSIISCSLPKRSTI